MKIFYSKFKYLLTGLLILISTNLIAAVTSLQGKGTAVEPYLIHTVHELIWMRDQVNNNNALFGDRHYKLMNDLDLIESADWIPIGLDSNSSFKGSFDGNGKVVKNLRIGSQDVSVIFNWAGFFGFINRGRVENLGIEELNIFVCSINVGSLVGYLSGNGSIINCDATGKIDCTTASTAYSFEVGGLVGASNGGRVLNCSSIVDISASSSYYPISVGGLVGYSSGSITNSYAMGDVSSLSESNSISGGVVGRLLGSLTNCYSTGSVSSLSMLYVSISGGVVGYSSGHLANCYSTGDVSSTSFAESAFSYAGGIVGKSEGDISDCYALNAIVKSINQNNHNYVGRVFGYGNSYSMFNFAKSDIIVCSGLSQNHLFPVADFSDPKHGQQLVDNINACLNKYVDKNKYSSLGVVLCYWDQTLDINNGYPILKLDSSAIVFNLKGNGSEFDPYKIYSNSDLIIMSAYINTKDTYSDKYYLLMNDLDFNEEKDWIPIGGVIPFSGIFEGNGKVIRNLSIGNSEIPSSIKYSGLFGRIYGGTVRNLGIECVRLSISTVNANHTGGLAGYSSGHIINCYVTGEVLSSSIAVDYVNTNTYVGGISGYSSGKIISCYTAGNFSANCALRSSQSSNLSYSYSGGIVGYSTGELINNISLNDTIESIHNYLISNAYASRIGYLISNSKSQNFAKGNMVLRVGNSKSTLIPIVPLGVHHGSTLIDQPVDVLNEWVRLNQMQDNAYRGWVVTEGLNNGYPVFVDIATSKDKTKFTENTIIRSIRGAVLVENAIMPIRVMNLSGLTVRQVMSPSDREPITLPKGFYVVCIGDRSEKVFVN